MVQVGWGLGLVGVGGGESVRTDYHNSRLRLGRGTHTDTAGRAVDAHRHLTDMGTAESSLQREASHW